MADGVSGISDVQTWAAFIGSGSRGPFPLTVSGASILYADPDEIFAARISSAGVISLLVNGIDYTLTSALDATTGLYVGTLTINADKPVLAAASGSTPAERLVVWREGALDQSFTLAFNTAFPSQSFTALQNKITQRLQELRDRIDRAPLVPIGEAPIDLGDKLTRRGKVLAGHPTTGALVMTPLAEVTDADGQVLVQEFEFEAAADQAEFTLAGVTLTAEAAVLVWVGGARQASSSYTLTPTDGDTVLTLGDGVSEGVAVNVVVLGGLGVADKPVSAFMESPVAAEDLAAFVLSLGGSAAARAALAAAGLADANVFTNALNTFQGRVLRDLTNVSYPSGHGVGLEFGKGSLLTIPTGWQLDVLFQADTITLEDNATFHHSNINITTDSATSGVGTDIRGYVANLLAGGLGTYSGAYCRAELVNAGYAADLFNFKSQLVTRAGVGTCWVHHVANDTSLGGTIMGVQWVSAVSATPANVNYTYLSDVKHNVQLAHIQYSAVGVGKVLLAKNSTASVDNFILDKDGNVRMLGALDIGHASDTTLARSSAGRTSVEGINHLLTADIATAAEARAGAATTKVLSPANLNDRASFRATLAANQTGIASVTFTKLAFATEAFDVGSLFDSATNYRWVPPAGKVRLSAAAFCSGMTAGTTLQLAIYRNGAEYAKAYVVLDASGGGWASVTCNAIANGSTDYFEVYVRGTTAGTITVDANNAFTHFEGEQI